MTDGDKELLAQLAQHEGWHTLVKVYTQVREDQYMKLAKALLNGTEISPLELAEKRGYYRALGEMLTTPGRVLDALLAKMDATD